MGHQPGQASPAGRVTSDLAEAVAQTMQALSTASRVRILAQLLEAPHTVGALAEAVEMEHSAVSQQLRMLRHLGLIVGRRQGRHVLYSLHDQHLGTLLAEAISHAEHLQLGISDSPPVPTARERDSSAAPRSLGRPDPVSGERRAAVT